MTTQAMATFARRTLADVPALPCRVDELTAREYAIYLSLAAVIAALQFLADQGDDDAPHRCDDPPPVPVP